jgi:hypothetical protein
MEAPHFSPSTCPCLQAWRRFCDSLQHTALSYLYVSERNLAGTDLKLRMRDAIRANRRCAAATDTCACTG